VSRLPVLSWCLYDWAYSAFTTIVVTFVFPTYFVRAVASDPVGGTAAWAAAQATAGLLIAVTAAPLGALADAGGRRRAFLGVATAMMAALTASLWFVRPGAQSATLALALVAAATVAFETATVFYNAMLPDIAARRRLGRVSGLAWAAGYAGGLVCLSLCLWLLISPDPPRFGLSRASAEPVRACALLAGAWIALFSWPLLAFGPRDAPGPPWRIALVRGAGTLGRAVREAAGNLTLRRFLVARMLYTDGLTALFAFGGIYAAGSFGMDAGQVLKLGIALNVTAGLGAAGFALIEDRIGAKATVLTALAALLGFGAGALLARSAGVFWVCALGLGAFVGPAQAASRSLMARLAPAATRNAGFGLYALSGRVTGFIGPMAFGAATAGFASQRAGMAAILVPLAAGGLLLVRTPVPTSA
jgi:MFS transporter, UMF1 family